MGNLREVDFAQYCKDLEEAAELTPTQIAKTLEVSLKSYYTWRKGERDPGGQATVKLILLARRLETEKGIKISFKLKL